MTASWQLQEAKSRFSELVNDAVNEGPQVVTRHGEDTVVVISIGEYRKLRRARGSLAEFFRKAPQVELDISRSRETGRGVDL